MTPSQAPSAQPSPASHTTFVPRNVTAPTENVLTNARRACFVSPHTHWPSVKQQGGHVWAELDGEHGGCFRGEWQTAGVVKPTRDRAAMAPARSLPVPGGNRADRQVFPSPGSTQTRPACPSPVWKAVPADPLAAAAAGQSGSQRPSAILGNLLVTSAGRKTTGSHRAGRR